MKEIFVKIRDFVSFWYLQYTLITSLYMLEPLERRLFNTILVVITAMFIYTSFYFMQPYMENLFSHFTLGNKKMAG